MEQILNREEIAQLIDAVRAGKIPSSGEEESVQERQQHSARSINLLKLTKADREIVRIPNFDIIIDIFSRLYGTTLTNQLQRTFTLRRTALETMELQEFMAETSNSGAIGVLDMHPLPSGALIIYDNQLSFSILEIMLGAAIDIESPKLDRRLTTLEINLIRATMTDVCGEIDRTFSQLATISSTLLKVENTTRLISIAEPDDEVIVATLQVTIRQQIGMIYMVFPLTTLDPLRAQLKELLKISSQKSTTWRDICAQQIQKIPLSVIAQSGEITMTVKDIMNMKIGDVLELNYDLNMPLQVLVEHRHKFNAIPGTHNGNKAISLVETVEN